MHFSTLFVALTTVACSLAVVANPTSVQSTSLTSRADCGTINGNCYDNGCDGDKSSDGLHCISGQYAGCPWYCCGFQDVASKFEIANGVEDVKVAIYIEDRT
ncbi:hypothetical protein GG344DRAFT_65466 [Lentinula edodes]|nr:hypothetical protein GG344DRAFT_65466 [Lentinula edodes]